MHDDYDSWLARPRTHLEKCMVASSDELAEMSMNGDRVAWLELLSRKIRAACDWSETNQENRT